MGYSTAEQGADSAASAPRSVRPQLKATARRDCPTEAGPALAPGRSVLDIDTTSATGYMTQPWSPVGIEILTLTAHVDVEGIAARYQLSTQTRAQLSAVLHR
ncbi:hypothetical protein MDOR_34940 [Mycolicibacterium doricum]|uniref:Uncharacterized protein n=1 Tax=Mycolicibacterium doricum TaxID=126673 RepID=A0A7I7VXY0_9MYCO|nr:hypothetical protein MDOR_34940 [Mycolicibacterium doricum]